MPKQVQPGDRVGIFRIISKCDEKEKHGHTLYRIECICCGREFVRTLTDTKRPKTCQHVGRYGYKEYNITKYPKLKLVYKWMNDRCLNDHTKSYIHYGLKGVKVCEEWKSYSAFEEWALAHGYEEGLTIDRIDPSGDYCPENCRWVSREYNSRFKSTTNAIEVEGIVMSGRQWSETLGLGINAINRKVRTKGMETTKAFIKERLETNMPG